MLCAVFGPDGSLIGPTRLPINVNKNCLLLQETPFFSTSRVFRCHWGNNLVQRFQIQHWHWKVYMHMKNYVFWDMTPCGSCKKRRFAWTHRFHHKDENYRWARNICYLVLTFLSRWFLPQEPHDVSKRNQGKESLTAQAYSGFTTTNVNSAQNCTLSIFICLTPTSYFYLYPPLSAGIFPSTCYRKMINIICQTPKPTRLRNIWGFHGGE
jgi:hypothetical protein